MSNKPAVGLDSLRRSQMDTARSRRLMHLVQAKDRYCYINSLRALYLVAGAHYVEGFAVGRTALPVEHAWIELNSVVIDPTPVFAQRRNGDTTYVPANRWTQSDIDALLEANGGELVTPVFKLWDSDDAAQRARWRLAEASAWRLVKDHLAVPRGRHGIDGA